MKMVFLQELNYANDPKYKFTVSAAMNASPTFTVGYIYLYLLWFTVTAAVAVTKICYCSYIGLL